MNLTTLIFVVGFPMLAPLVATALLWKRLERRWLFLVISFLSIYGIADFSLMSLRDLLVPAIPDPLPSDLLGFNIEMAQRTQLTMLLTDAIVLIVGIPLLAWLFSALRRSSPNAAVR